VLRSGSSAQPPATHAPQGLPRPDDLWAASGFFTLKANPVPVLQRTFRSLAQLGFPQFHRTGGQVVAQKTST
jgi:hypothetical protein